MSKTKQLKDNLKNFFSRITVKQIILIILFGILICAASSSIGYYLFSTTLKNIYNTKITNIANLVKENINISEYEQDMTVLKSSFLFEESPVFEQISQQPGYTELVKQMNYLEESIEGLEIMISNYSESFSEPALKYYTDQDPDEEVAEILKEGGLVGCIYYRSPSMTPDIRKPNEPGGPILADKEEKETILKMYEDKTPQYTTDAEFVVSESSSSEVFSIFIINDPLLNDTGDVIGTIAISLRVTIIRRLLLQFLTLVVALTALLGIIFIIIYILINRHTFLNPMLSIIKGTSTFVKNNHQITESLEEIKTGDEIQTLAESVLKLETDINEYIENLAKVTAERERVKADLDLANNIQMSMLPRDIPEVEKRKEFEISALVNPAKEVGGDFYNYFMIDDDHLGFVVGDVSGKGVPAALFMMIGTTLIKTVSVPEEEVNTIIEQANDILSANNAEMLFITAWMGIYEISTGTVTFVNAGHEPPVLVHENGEFEFIKTKANLALGTFGGLPYRKHELQLQKGDKLFLYTDGVVEAQNEAQEFYKFDRLTEIVKSTYKEDVHEMVRSIRKDIDAFVDGAEQFDDITIFGLEIKEPSGNEKNNSY